MLKIKCSTSKNDDKVYLNLDINDGRYSKSLELKRSEVTLISIVGIENVTAELVEKTSRKTGEIYTCFEVSIGEEYKTPVFLDNAEKVIIDYLNAD